MPDGTTSSRAHAVTAPPAWRYATVAALVGVWMLAGWWLGLDANAYLLLGIPLVVAFHLGVRRLPLSALWVVDAPPLRLTRRAIVIATLLALVPLADLVVACVQRDVIRIVFFAAAIVGAGAAAYALSHLAVRWRFALGYMTLIVAMSAVLWSALLANGSVSLSVMPGGIGQRIAIGALSLLEYFAVAFVVEEVAFRALDRHLDTEATWRGLPSGVYISALWGLWHLPIAGSAGVATALQLVAIHMPFGVALSYAWRRTGNLVLPALGHAMVDAIRNALVGVA